MYSYEAEKGSNLPRPFRTYKKIKEVYREHCVGGF